MRQPHVRRRCMPPLEDSCSPRSQPPRPRWSTSRWWEVLYPSLPAMTKGGRAMERRQGVRRPRRRRHWSLPPPCVSMPPASERLCRVRSDSLTCIVRFDFRMSRPPAHIAEKLFATRARWMGCEDARAKRSPRDSAWPRAGVESRRVPGACAGGYWTRRWRGNGEELSIPL